MAVAEQHMQLRHVAPDLWRVSIGDVQIVGHLRRIVEAGQERFIAQRYHGGDGAFRELGRFWREHEALDCLRYAR